MPSPARRSKLTSPTPLLWSTGVPFSGSAIVTLVPPTGRTELRLYDTVPSVVIPLLSEFPIVEGVFNDYCRLIYNADLNPPNSQYLIAYYDNTDTLIASSATKFTVTTDNTTPPIPVLTAPALEA